MGFLSFMGHRILAIGLIVIALLLTISGIFAMMGSGPVGLLFWLVALICGVAGAYFLSTKH
ncbi:hypothetical protein HN385_04875 [archaeon]|jgi:hypothetical protein|nr:hypothetical protein [archaeon]MBT7193597.1 hypothetical protein [archaeon]